MNTSIVGASRVLGGVSALAEALSVTRSAISEWSSGRRPVPIERCVQIEQVTSGAVRRWELRPNDWHRIWPELVDAPGAPAVPEAQQAR